MNSASLPPNQWLTIAGVHAGPVGDHAHGRAVVAALGEPRAGGGEQSSRVSAPPRRAAAPARAASAPVVRSAAVTAPSSARPVIVGALDPGCPGCPGRGRAVNPLRRLRRWAHDLCALLPPVGSVRSAPRARSSASSRSDRRVIPVVRRLLADDETPSGSTASSRATGPARSCSSRRRTGGPGRAGRSSGRARRRADRVDGEAVWTGDAAGRPAPSRRPAGGAARDVEELHTDPLPGLPPLTGGLVGYLGYDAVRRLERLPDPGRRRPAAARAGDAAGDRPRGRRPPRGHGHPDRQRDQLGRQRRAGRRGLRRRRRPPRPDDRRAGRAGPATVAVYQPAEPRFPAAARPPSTTRPSRRPRSRSARARRSRWCVSQRFETWSDGRPARRLPGAARDQPQPVHVPAAAADLDGFDIVGSSPEALVTVRDGEATTHPIAGTRWRGADRGGRRLLEKDLLADEKERAEHVMLVDLGRNDLGRVCKPGSVKVVDFFTVERYSHVMHLVSTVTGRLRRGPHRLRRGRRVLPGGHAVRARRSRARWRSSRSWSRPRRGLYGGVVGYLDFAGDADTAIAIRTALVRDGVAYVQAGGGHRGRLRPGRRGHRVPEQGAGVLSAVATAATRAAVAPSRRGG